MSGANFAGLIIVQRPYAERRWVEFKVEPWPIRKRRRNWRVRRYERREPGCYQVGNTLYMHPELFAKFKRATPNTKD